MVAIKYNSKHSMIQKGFFKIILRKLFYQFAQLLHFTPWKYHV